MRLLCLTFGVLVPDELLARLTYAEYQGWVDYYRRKPWGEERSDMRQAVQIEWFLHPWKKKNAKKPPNFLFPYWETQSTHSNAELMAWMAVFDSALVPKDGGGYELNVPMEELIERINGD